MTAALPKKRFTALWVAAGVGAAVVLAAVAAVVLWPDSSGPTQADVSVCRNWIVDREALSGTAKSLGAEGGDVDRTELAELIAANSVDLSQLAWDATYGRLPGLADEFEAADDPELQELGFALQRALARGEPILVYSTDVAEIKGNLDRLGDSTEAINVACADLGITAMSDT